jgi:hypothetical protein
MLNSADVPCCGIFPSRLDVAASTTSFGFFVPGVRGTRGTLQMIARTVSPRIRERCASSAARKPLGKRSLAW